MGCLKYNSTQKKFFYVTPLPPLTPPLTLQAITWGLEMIITDIDALVLREPFAYMARWPDAGFLTTSDCLGNTTGSDRGGLEDSGCLGQAMNIGCAPRPRAETRGPELGTCSSV